MSGGGASCISIMIRAILMREMQGRKVQGVMDKKKSEALIKCKILVEKTP